MTSVSACRHDRRATRGPILDLIAGADTNGLNPIEPVANTDADRDGERH